MWIIGFIFSSFICVFGLLVLHAACVFEITTFS